MEQLLEQLRAIVAEVEALIAESQSASEAGNTTEAEAKLNEAKEKQKLAESKQQEIERLRMKKYAQETSAEAALELASAKLAMNRLPVSTEQKTYATPRRENDVFDSNETAYKAGKFLISVLSSSEHARKSAQEYCEQKGVNYKTLTSAVDGSAGLFVIPEIEQAIVERQELLGIARRESQKVSMNGESKIFWKEAGNNTAYFIGAAGEPASTDATWSPVTLTAKKIAAMTKYNEDLNEDAVIALATEVTKRLGAALARKEDEACFNGDGTNAHGGIIGLTQIHRSILTAGGGTWETDANKLNLASAQSTTGNTWASITLNDILALCSKVDIANDGTYKWYGSNAFFHEVLYKFITQAGGITATEMVNGVGYKFFNREYVVVPCMPSTSAINTVPLIYGNLQSAALFGDRQGVQIKTDASGANFRQDTVEVKATARFDYVIHEAGNYSTLAAQRRMGTVASLIVKNS